MIMGNYIGGFIIIILIVFSIGIIYAMTQIVESLREKELFETSITYNWIIKLIINLLGYATVLLPGYLVYRYVKYTKYLQKSGKGILHKLVQKCFLGSGEISLLDSTNQLERTVYYEAGLLAYCFFGLQISYITWGYFQEKIMTQEYVNKNNERERFKNSQFLVFVNRILAFIMSGLYLLLKRQPRHLTPYYKYVFCSLSNIMSSWCQYEALKYVSFPIQVLAKASKIIPVIIMGKIVFRNSYEYYEYGTACLISIGMTLFMLGSIDHQSDGATTISGIILLASYMVFDSFTNNWQNALFKNYGVTSVQMMCAVNMFSCLLTATSLLQQSAFSHSLNFIIKFPSFIFDCLLISICSTSGQLFIFYTISQFGTVTFIIIMAIRQGLAILLSCIVYQHRITIIGVIGVFIVFGAIFLQIYCKNRIRTIKK